MTLRLDFSNMLGTGGIAAGAWQDAGEQFRRAHDGVMRLHKDGSLGWIDLPGDTRLLQQSLDFAERTRNRFSDVVILGIGGSALGPIALRTALRPSGWNMLTHEARGGCARMHVLDNVDPETIVALLERLDLRQTLFVVTSKSGGTAETMAQFLIVRDRLQKVVKDDREHIVLITDPSKGALRPIANAEQIPALDIPPNVGGRFSVLTPVGMLPAALMGIDITALLKGAGDMAERCRTNELSKNPAGVFAMLQWLAGTTAGKHIHVLMPYSDALRDMAAWFVQLWAESLGKVRKDGTSVGATPLGALGATDQHSQVQLFMEGPADKTVTFLAVEERSVDVQIPALHRDIPELAYLGGHSLGELISIEQRATAGALAKRGRPNMTLHVDRIDPWHIGGLMMFLEIATAYAGELYEIDAFNQPGVELGKQFAYALLGRKDADPSARKEWDAVPKPDPRWSV